MQGVGSLNFKCSCTMKTAGFVAQRKGEKDSRRNNTSLGVTVVRHKHRRWPKTTRSMCTITPTEQLKKHSQDCVDCRRIGLSAEISLVKDLICFMLNGFKKGRKKSVKQMA